MNQRKIGPLRSLCSQESRRWGAPSRFLSSFPPYKQSGANLQGADGNSHFSCWQAVERSELLCCCRLQGSYLMLITVRARCGLILGTCTRKWGISENPGRSVRSELRMTLSPSYLKTRSLWSEAVRRPGENETHTDPFPFINSFRAPETSPTPLQVTFPWAVPKN